MNCGLRGFICSNAKEKGFYVPLVAGLFIVCLLYNMMKENLQWSGSVCGQCHCLP
jgi:hypothetical protein